ncbi:hypothetical protein C8T65DRAFT_831964 [Cerioporus squamosus]|nr:hypothetical protein C8T65DRAFT_831964 [Cerioporus squamosus]
MQRPNSLVEAIILAKKDGRCVESPVRFGTVAEAAEQLKSYEGSHDLISLTLPLSEGETSLVDISVILALDLPNVKHLRLESTPPANDTYDYQLAFDTEPYPTNPGTDFEDFITAQAMANPFVFSYRHLLDALSRWSGLEVVEIVNFLHIVSKDPYDIPTLACPVVLSNLKSFFLEDLPGRMQHFLGYLHLPLNASVWLKTTTGMRPLEADMVQEMLPQQPAVYQDLPMRNMAAQVQVKIGPKSLMVGGAVSHDRNRFVLEVCPVSTGTFNSHDAGGDLLRSLLRSLPNIFDPSVVKHLRICGEITYIRSGDDWANALRPFCNLEVLHLEDDALGKHGFVNALFEGLIGDVYDVQERREAPVCPRLRALVITDASVSKDDIKSMYEGLEERKKRGRPLLVFKLQFRNSGLTKSKLQQAVNKLSGPVVAVEWQERHTLRSYVHIPAAPPPTLRTRKRRR